MKGRRLSPDTKTSVSGDPCLSWFSHIKTEGFLPSLAKLLLDQATETSQFLTHTEGSATRLTELPSEDTDRAVLVPSGSVLAKLILLPLSAARNRLFAPSNKQMLGKNDTRVFQGFTAPNRNWVFVAQSISDVFDGRALP